MNRKQKDKLKLFGYSKSNVKETFGMAWPAMTESFFSAFAGLVDSFMVSSMGAAAVASVGLTLQPRMMGLALFFAVNVAVSALVARRFGEKKQEDANRILYTAVLFIIVMAAIISIVAVAFANQIISLCGSTQQTHDGAVAYFRIVMGGMIFNCVQMGINAAQRGAGKTRITMRTNMTSNIVNIICNYLLIDGHLGFPAWGIRGAAIATVFGTVVACVMSIFSVYGKENFISISYIVEHKVKPAMSAVVNLIKIGYSVFLEQLLMRIGFVLTAVMAAHQGTDAMAAHQVAMNVMGLSFSFGDGLQAAAVALIGRSLGQGNQKLAKEFGSICRFIGGFISVCLALIYLLGGRGLYQLFFAEENIVDIGVGIIRVIILIVVFQIGQVVYMGCLRGAGDTLYTAIASTVSVSLIRTAGSYFFGYILGMGITGIWLGVLADQISRFIFASVRFKAGKWTGIKI